MKLISHRGNLSGPSPENENKIPYVQRAIDRGYDVEIDVRLIDNNLYLGHDSPDYLVDLSWLLDRKEHLLVHAKNFQAMSFLIKYDLRIFYHQVEKHTVIGNTKNLWSCDIGEATEKSIIPLISLEEVEKYKNLVGNFYGVCSDYVGDFNTIGETL